MSLGWSVPFLATSQNEGVMVALKEQARRWVEVDGKQERGSRQGKGEGATRPGTAMTEQERDGARYKGQARSAWLWDRKCVCGRTVLRRPLSAPLRPEMAASAQMLFV